MDRRKAQRNIGCLGLVMLAALAVVLFRYAWLQLVQGSELAARMRAQVGESYLVQSTRGAILDRSGRELAVSTMTKSLYVDPNHVKEPQVLASELAPLIGLSEQQILDYLDSFGLETGYLLSFCFNKNKKSGVERIQIGTKTLFEGVV